MYDEQDKLIETKFPKKFDFLKSFFVNWYGKDFCVKIVTKNSFPTKAGLASSASGACALVMAFVRLINFFDENEAEKN